MNSWRWRRRRLLVAVVVWPFRVPQRMTIVLERFFIG
jgi:hypothetical protein